MQKDHSPIDGVWYSRSEQQYDDNLHQFKLVHNNLEFFAEGKACIIKELGKDTFYSLKLGSTVIEISAQTAKPDGPSTNHIKGKYFLITNDSLVISGRRRTDSILWAFKRRKQ